MSLTFNQARDEMLALVKTAWDTTGYEIYWDDVAEDQTSSEVPYAVAHLKHADGFKATLGSHENNNRFRRLGFVKIEIFTPIGKGLQDSDTLAKVVADAFEGKKTPGGAWFQNVRLNEIGRKGQFQQVDIIADFQYDEVK